MFYIKPPLTEILRIQIQISPNYAVDHSFYHLSRLYVCDMSIQTFHMIS